MKDTCVFPPDCVALALKNGESVGTIYRVHDLGPVSHCTAQREMHTRVESVVLIVAS